MKKTNPGNIEQEVLEYICEHHAIPVPVLKYRRGMTRCWGRASWYWSRTRPDRISLAMDLKDKAEELRLSVLIHEACHIVLRQQHTAEFFKLSDYWHREFGLHEDRATASRHGRVYAVAADGREIPLTPLE